MKVIWIVQSARARNQIMASSGAGMGVRRGSAMQFGFFVFFVVVKFWVQPIFFNLSRVEAQKGQCKCTIPWNGAMHALCLARKGQSKHPTPCGLLLEWKVVTSLMGQCKHTIPSNEAMHAFYHTWKGQCKRTISWTRGNACTCCTRMGQCMHLTSLIKGNASTLECLVAYLLNGTSSPLEWGNVSTPFLEMGQCMNFASLEKGNASTLRLMGYLLNENTSLLEWGNACILPLSKRAMQAFHLHWKRLCKYSNLEVGQCKRATSLSGATQVYHFQMGQCKQTPLLE